MNHSDNSGRTMVEMMGVLVIISTFIITAVIGYQNAKSKHTANVAFKDTNIIATRLALAKNQANLTPDQNSGSLANITISLADYPNYKNAGIKVNFKGDIKACHQFEQMNKNKVDFATANKCDENFTVCLVPEYVDLTAQSDCHITNNCYFKYNGQKTSETAQSIANTLCGI